MLSPSDLVDPPPCLPEEIWDQIIRNLVDDKKALTAFGKTSKQMNRITVPILFERVNLKTSMQSVSLLRRLVDMPQFRDFVKELELRIGQQTVSQNHVSERVHDFGRTVHYLLFDRNSERFFKRLKKLTIRFPVEYRAPVEYDGSCIPAVDDGIYLLQKHERTHRMCFLKFFDLISRWTLSEQRFRERRSASRLFVETPAPTTLELANFTLDQSLGLLHQAKRLASIKTLQIHLCPAQATEKILVPTPRHIQREWIDFDTDFGTGLEKTFPNVETLHLTGWWGQGRYYYLRDISDMTLNLFLLDNRLSNWGIKSLILEDLVLYSPTAAIPTQVPNLTLKNCMLATDWKSPDPRADNPWEEVLSNASSPPVTPGDKSNFELRIESAKGVEGHPSAFQYATYKDPREDAMIHNHGGQTLPAWREADVRLEEGAAARYWEMNCRNDVREILQLL
ncbi:hypothetical protein FQN54_001454 [Arachnomyces sp. PD_36]|nr:hypothetical protein FQN54_001454 [Arachnomyces sp. PD_36]